MFRVTGSEKKGPIHTELREQVHVTSNQNNIIPFVATYNPRDYNIFHFMKQIEFLSVNSHSSPQFSFGFTYIEFSTIRANNCVYKILSFA
jgi:hypothetical protein